MAFAVYKAVRFFRSMHDIQEVFDLFKAQGVAFYSYSVMENWE